MIRPALLASCLVMFACDQKDAAPPKAAAPQKMADKGPGPAPVAAADPAKPKVGLELPGNDAKVVALARKAITCRFARGFESACAEYKAWKDEQAAFSENRVFCRSSG